MYFNGCVDASGSQVYEVKARLASARQRHAARLTAMKQQLKTRHGAELAKVHATHVFSCEISAPKQIWIVNHFDPDFVFANILELGLEIACCATRCSYERVPSCDSIFAGTSCVDFSTQKATDKTRALSDGIGSSAITLIGFRKYIRRCIDYAAYLYLSMGI